MRYIWRLIPDLKKLLLLLPAIFLFSAVFAQGSVLGLLTGNVVDEKKKALEGATVVIISLTDTLSKRSTLTNKTGDFSLKSNRSVRK